MRALALLVAAAAFPRAAALVVYYNVFSKNVATAVEIVAHPRPDPEEQTELQYDRGRVANAVWRGAPRVVAPPAEVPADLRRARAGAETLTKRSDDGVGVNPSVFTYR